MVKIKWYDFFKGDRWSEKRAMKIWDVSSDIQNLIYTTQAWRSNLRFKKDQEAMNIAKRHLQAAKNKISLIGHRINKIEFDKK